MIKLPPTVKNSIFAGVVTLTLAIVSSEEGVRYDAYLDIVGIPTICYGDTADVHLGQTASVEECSNRLISRLDQLFPKVRKALQVDVNDQVLAALSSFCDNVGLKGCTGSETFRYVNSGQVRLGCDALLNWTRAKNKRLALYKRRMRERMLCLIGDDVAHGMESNLDDYQTPPKWFTDKVKRWGLKLP